MSPADKLQQLIREIEQADSFLDQVPIFRQAGPWIKQHWPSFYQDYQSLERQASSSAELMFLNASALATVGSSVPIVLSNQHMEDEMIAFLTRLVEVAEPQPDTDEPARAEAVGELWQRWITNEITALELVVGLHGLGLDPYKLPHTRDVANKEPRDQAEQLERGWGYLVENHYDGVTQIDFGRDRGLSRSTVNRAVRVVEGILEHAGVGTEERIRLIRVTET